MSTIKDIKNTIADLKAELAIASCMRTIEIEKELCDLYIQLVELEISKP